jgi:DNA-binding response OmpR family regulator
MNLRILVVEDHADSADSLALLVRLYGHHVYVASTGEEAIAAARWAQAVLLDIGLPGMDGYEVARRIREERPDTPPFIAAVTGCGREEDRSRSEEAGIHVWLVKPVDPAHIQAFLATLERVIGPAPQPPAG